MQSIPPLVILAGLLAVVLGLPFGLYAILTRHQRRTTREIRTAAAGRGWRYRPRRWQGNPTAFRIDGQTRTGPWILTSGNSRGYDTGWSVELVLRFPKLGGATDLAILPRERAGHGPPLREAAVQPGAESRIAALSRVLATAVQFLRDAVEMPSGLPGFDAAYQVLGLPGQMRERPVDEVLAKRIFEWPAGVIAPHSVLAWRDLYAFEFQARLPAPPNWATVSYFLALADDLMARVPPPMSSPAPRGFVDRLIGHFTR